MWWKRLSRAYRARDIHVNAQGLNTYQPTNKQTSGKRNHKSQSTAIETDTRRARERENRTGKNLDPSPAQPGHAYPSPHGPPAGTPPTEQAHSPNLFHHHHHHHNEQHPLVIVMLFYAMLCLPNPTQPLLQLLLRRVSVWLVWAGLWPGRNSGPSSFTPTRWPRHAGHVTPSPSLPSLSLSSAAGGQAGSPHPPGTPLPPFPPSCPLHWLPTPGGGHA